MKTFQDVFCEITAEPGYATFEPRTQEALMMCRTKPNLKRKWHWQRMEKRAKRLYTAKTGIKLGKVVNWTIFKQWLKDNWTTVVSVLLSILLMFI